MSDQPRYVLTVEQGMEVLHRDPGEKCSDFLRQTIDAHTADALLTRNYANRCIHCFGAGA